MNQLEFYYQIEFIDENEVAAMFDSLDDEQEAIKKVQLLNDANVYYKGKGHFTLDLYVWITGDDSSHTLVCKDYHIVKHQHKDRLLP